MYCYIDIQSMAYTYIYIYLYVTYTYICMYVSHSLVNIVSIISLFNATSKCRMNTNSFIVIFDLHKLLSDI